MLYRIDKLFGGNANVTPPSAISEPSYNDADWFPVNDDLPSGKDNGGHGDDAPGTQGSCHGVEAGDKENADPNLQGSPSASPERSACATEPSSAANAAARAATASSGKKTGTTRKQRKSACKTKAATAADAKGVDKATNPKRKDFGSVYTAASEARQAFNEQKFTVQMEWKKKLLWKSGVKSNWKDTLA
ncbi:hypothetical protein PF008_g22871 [Phytophthora fragariae]|uniref:Uncharacterized protein n=1 Tax=Phytophthora fragariae TaxID=53985 RepID=A0A6G0QSF3_9STRA|nr:hypothetical protein PF008_g22871 [Phytophthora fragariae]